MQSIHITSDRGAKTDYVRIRNVSVPPPPPGLSSIGQFSSGSRDEFVALIVRQLRCGQVTLTGSPRAGGTVLAVGKPGGNRQRAVWHGRRVSQAAILPPKPPLLVSPSALLHLRASVDEPIRVSKRDAACWFDQLALPSSLRKWMARPSVGLGELMRAGLTRQELKHMLEPGETLELIGQQLLWPVSCCWPMGFSWSSYVARSFTLEVCAQAGLQREQALTCDQPTPDMNRTVFGAATDDVMIFSRSGEGETLRVAQDLEVALERQGGQINHNKDVNDELNATCVDWSLET